MIIGAVIGWMLVPVIYVQHPAWTVPYEGLLKWLSIFWTLFVGVGGICTLKRKVWGMCLFTGIAFIISYFITKKQNNNEKSEG